LALAVGVSSWPAEGSALSGRSVASGAAHLWLTTADGTYKLTDMGEIPFGTGVPTVPTVVVDPSRIFQTMDGFGGAITDSSAVVLYRMSAAARAAAMRMLFDSRTGDGLSYLRQPIGGSDFVATAPYTYDDMPAGATDYAQRHFSIAHDEAEILPLLREAKRLNPRLQIIASPWSPPAWMKTGDSLIGGRLIDTPQIYHSYALYLTKFIEAYRSQDVTVNTITVQNEPQNRTPGNYPGTDMSAAQEEKVIEALGPMLRAAGLKTQILAYDHNWSEHPNDIASTPPDETQDTNDYPQEVLSSPAARWVAGTAYHCYYGDPSAMTTLHDEFPAKDIYFTECSGSQSSDPANTFSDTLKWHARNLIIGSPRNWAKTVINWNVALDPSGGPHVGGCGNCTGILTIGPGDKVTPDAEYYTLGHLSRFVQPGAVRIASTSFGITGWNGEVMDVAFRDPDGTTVLVAHNENDSPQAFGVLEGDRSFAYTLPGDSLATFTWPGNPGGRRGPEGARSLRLACDRQPIRAHRPVLPGRRGRKRGRRRREHPVLDRDRAGAGSVPPGRLRPSRAGPRDRLRHGRQPRRLPSRLRGDRELRRHVLEHRGRKRNRHRTADRRAAVRRAGAVRAHDLDRVER
jgi:glucosylceramidase